MTAVQIAAWLILAVLLGGMGSQCAHAQDPSASLRAGGHHGLGHAQHHDWYKDLKQPGTGYSCCNGDSVDADGNRREGDCRPTRAWQDENGQWIAIIDGRPVPVPPRVVLQKLAPDGTSHICASKSGMIYCFIGGSPKS